MHFDETGEIWELADDEEVECNLEWFDSRDPEENARVVDREGRVVHLKVEMLKILVFELEE